MVRGSTLAKAAFGWVFVPVLAGFCLIVVLLSVGPTWQAAVGAGSPGVFTAVHRECPPPGRSIAICSWYGTFRADDGSIGFEDVLLDKDPRGWRPGTTADVVWTGSSDPLAVYRPKDVGPLVLVSAFGLISLSALTAWIVAMVWAIRRKKTPRWVQALQHVAHWSDAD